VPWIASKYIESMLEKLIDDCRHSGHGELMLDGDLDRGIERVVAADRSTEYRKYLLDRDSNAEVFE
jgi:hypothetical protein